MSGQFSRMKGRISTSEQKVTKSGKTMWKIIVIGPSGSLPGTTWDDPTQYLGGQDIDIGWKSDPKYGVTFYLPNHQKAPQSGFQTPPQRPQEAPGSTQIGSAGEMAYLLRMVKEIHAFLKQNGMPPQAPPDNVDLGQV